MNDFLPKEYEVPESSTGYMKFKQGENRFRILSSAIIGWEAWKDTEEGRRPVRWRMNETQNVAEIDSDPKHFWAFVVWNYQEKRIQILEITQKGIQKSIRSLTKDEDWGDPKQYDLVVNREGEGLETEYQVAPKPHKELHSEIKKMYDALTVNLEALFEGEDPFQKVLMKEIDEEIAKL